MEIRFVLYITDLRGVEPTLLFVRFLVFIMRFVEFLSQYVETLGQIEKCFASNDFLVLKTVL